MNISDTQLDLASLFSRIEQLEAEQNLCKQNVIWLKRYIDEFRKEFNTRPELQQIESWQQAIAQLSTQVAELQQRLNHSPILSKGLDNGVTTNAQTESANLDDAEVVKQFFEPVEQQQSYCALVDALTIPVHVDTAETDQNQEINVVTQQKPRVTALSDEEFKLERMMLLLDRIYKAEEDSQETPIAAEELLVQEQQRTEQERLRAERAEQVQRAAIAQLLVMGLSQEQIAETLGLSIQLVNQAAPE